MFDLGVSSKNNTLIYTIRTLAPIVDMISKRITGTNHSDIISEMLTLKANVNIVNKLNLSRRRFPYISNRFLLLDTFISEKFYKAKIHSDFFAPDSYCTS